MPSKPTMSVPLLDLNVEHRPLSRELEDAFKGVVASSHFILGPKVQELERKLAEYLGTTHAIGCASGSDALLLALFCQARPSQKTAWWPPAPCSHKTLSPRPSTPACRPSPCARWMRSSC